MLLDKDEEISKLKNYNQDLKYKIKNFKDTKGPPDRSDNDLEEE